MTRRLVLLAAAASLALTACGSGAAATSPTTASPGSPSPSVASSFDPAASADVYLPTAPATDRPVAVVVVIPGGGWQTSDRSGMTDLAQRLSAAGDVVVSSTYRAGDVGARFPVPLQDVRCAAAYAVARARAAGFASGPVVLVGHSAGGHLVALAAVSGTALAAPCADPVPHIDGVVGLAGVYDTASFADYMTSFFGAAPAADPALWDSGDPLHYVESGAVPKPLKVLLVHGDADDVVPLAQSQKFAAALTAAGVPAQLEVLPGETHMSVIEPAVSAERITKFVSSLAATYAATATPAA